MSDEVNLSSLQRRLKSLFAIDARSLAVLRVGTALLIMFYLSSFVGSIDTFFSESGVLPQELGQRVVGNEGSWSLLWLGTSPNVVRACAGIFFVASIALLLGFRTFWATVICLVMAWSFHIRNPLILTGGDVLLRMILFWGMFLPWGSCWSLDSRRYEDVRPARWNVTSFATAAIMLQLAGIYFFSGLAKLNGTWEKTAILQGMNLEMYARPLGKWLGRQEWVEAIAAAVPWLEVVGPVLLFVPFVFRFWRGSMMALMWLMHLAIWATMSIGIFSAVSILLWIVFVPSEIWNGLLGRPESFGQDLLEENWKLKRSWQYVAAFMLLFVMALNFSGVGRPEPPWVMRTIACATMTQQEFKMFQDPPVNNPWPRYPAQLFDGTWIDLFSRDTIDSARPKKPSSVYAYMQNHLWRRFHHNLINREVLVDGDFDFVPREIYGQLRERLLNVMVQKWNDRNSNDKLVREASLIMNFDEMIDGRPSGKSRLQVWATR